MPDYKQGKIYKIISNQTNLVYVGSTAMPRLSIRMAKHRCDEFFFWPVLTTPLTQKRLNCPDGYDQPQDNQRVLRDYWSL